MRLSATPILNSKEADRGKAPSDELESTMLVDSKNTSPKSKVHSPSHDGLRTPISEYGIFNSLPLSTTSKRKLLVSENDARPKEKKHKILATEDVELSLICRLGNPATLSALQNLIRRVSPNLVFLSETRLVGAWTEVVKRQVGFSNGLVVDCVGRSDVLILLWQED
ncbi:hypothetical protein TorRG33x02_064820 [Trema orientale]|uniref:Endonuclease/exonuclease/phosphatase n=1 Tax=Trema orientale TaxID=63057 RepID=A0A2P5FIF8_TREOI|nr:hypothetical protein TorRG33x02_064820 [Trema orientale]